MNSLTNGLQNSIICDDSIHLKWDIFRCAFPLLQDRYIKIGKTSQTVNKKRIIAPLAFGGIVNITNADEVKD